MGLRTIQVDPLSCTTQGDPIEEKVLRVHQEAEDRATPDTVGQAQDPSGQPPIDQDGEEPARAHERADGREELDIPGPEPPKAWRGKATSRAKPAPANATRGKPPSRNTPKHRAPRTVREPSPCSGIRRSLRSVTQPQSARPRESGCEGARLVIGSATR